MSRFYSYINSSKNILENYKGEEPFSFHLKKYFTAHKNMGSKDRKFVSELCYCWLRTYHVFKGKLDQEVLIKSLFLCNTQPHSLLEALDDELNKKINLSVSKKALLLELNLDNLFPFSGELGDINQTEFIKALLLQPDLFLRIRPGQKKRVIDKITLAQIEFNLVEEDCLALANSSHIDQLLKLNKEVVIQDVSSQKVFNFFKNNPFENKTVDAWDACAASGGKAILLYDLLKGKVKLTVTDIREGILQNCNKRLQQAGINIYQSFVADLTKEKPLNFTNNFDVIICDVPCSGSGTWGRTPEQMAFFKTQKIKEYAVLQQKIALHAAKYLNAEGLFFYITCSVFKKENEDNVDVILKETKLQLLKSEYIEGAGKKADTLFVAVFKN